MTETTTETLRADLTMDAQARLATLATVCANPTRPILTAIRLVGAAGIITATATDSFRLAQLTCEYDGDDFTALIPGRDFAAAVKAIKGWARIEITSTKWQLVGHTASVGGDLVEGSYPSVDPLIPSENDYLISPEAVAFSPVFLADMTKLAPIATARPRDRKYAASKLVSAASPVKPTVWHLICQGQTTLYLLMPVRIS